MRALIEFAQIGPGTKSRLDGAVNDQRMRVSRKAVERRVNFSNSSRVSEPISLQGPRCKGQFDRASRDLPGERLAAKMILDSDSVNPQPAGVSQ